MKHLFHNLLLVYGLRAHRYPGLFSGAGTGAASAAIVSRGATVFSAFFEEKQREMKLIRAVLKRAIQLSAEKIKLLPQSHAQKEPRSA
jgi:hypothetical protein